MLCRGHQRDCPPQPALLLLLPLLARLLFKFRVENVVLPEVGLLYAVCESEFRAFLRKIETVALRMGVKDFWRRRRRGGGNNGGWR